MNFFTYLFNHHGGFFVDNELSKYEGIVSKLKCDIDTCTYFEILSIIHDLGYKEVGTIQYKDPTLGMHTLADDIGA